MIMNDHKFREKARNRRTVHCEGFLLAGATTAGGGSCLTTASVETDEQGKEDSEMADF